MCSFLLLLHLVPSNVGQVVMKLIEADGVFTFAVEVIEELFPKALDLLLLKLVLILFKVPHD